MRFSARDQLSRDRFCFETRSLAPNQPTRADPPASHHFIITLYSFYFLTFHPLTHMSIQVQKLVNKNGHYKMVVLTSPGGVG